MVTPLTLSLDDVIKQFFRHRSHLEILPLKIYSMEGWGETGGERAVRGDVLRHVGVVFVTHFCLKDRK
jgi:ABC-type spermidine/putrescine transport system permease subunit II